MTIVHRDTEGLKQELLQVGYSVVATDYFDDFNRIVFSNGEHSFVLQFQKTYHYRFIYQLFTRLKVVVPEDVLHVIQQEEQIKRSKS